MVAFISNLIFNLLVYEKITSLSLYYFVIPNIGFGSNFKCFFPFKNYCFAANGISGSKIYIGCFSFYGIKKGTYLLENNPYSYIILDYVYNDIAEIIHNKTLKT